MRLLDAMRSECQLLSALLGSRESCALALAAKAFRAAAADNNYRFWRAEGAFTSLQILPALTGDAKEVAEDQLAARGVSVAFHRFGEEVCRHPLSAIFAYGGETRDGSRLGVGMRVYTSNGDAAQAKMPMPAQPSDPVAYCSVATRNAREFLVFGGSDEYGLLSNLLRRAYYDLSKDAYMWQNWKASADAPSPRFGCSFTFEKSSERVYLFGGATAGVEKYSLVVKDATLYYLEPGSLGMEHMKSSAVNNPGVWGRVAVDGGGEWPGPRTGHSCVSVSRRLIICGGKASTGDAPCLDDVYAYAVETETWSKLPSDGATFRPRWGHAACLLADASILVFGGKMSGLDGALLDDLLVGSVDEGGIRWDSVRVAGLKPVPQVSATLGVTRASTGEANIALYGGIGRGAPDAQVAAALLSTPSAGACRFWTAKLEVDGLSPFPAWEPPSETVKWKECSHSHCRKWRVVPPETEDGGFFYCTQLSVWDPDHARCDASEEGWEEE
jgi:hypothetical protein